MTEPDGWSEVYSGACVQADVLQAVLEANGLRAVVDKLSPQAWWSGSVLEDCRVYVPSVDAERAREILASDLDDA